MADKETPVAAATQGSGFYDGERGVVIRQELQVGEIAAQMLGICYEKTNEYKLAPLPEGKSAIKSLSDEAGWTPTMDEINAVAYNSVAKEEGNCILNAVLTFCKLQNLRPFEMTIDDKKTGSIRLKKDFGLGGACCCPHTIEISDSKDTLIGRVIEDWNCSNYCCRYCEAAYCCKTPYKLQVMQNGMFVDRYNVEMNLFICGAHNNFCGATPFCSNALFDVNKYNADGAVIPEPVGHIQKTYGGKGGFESFLRCCCGDISNYVVEWPEDSTPQDRAVIVGATTLFEFIFFER